MRALYNEMNQAVTAVLQNPANPYNFGLRSNKWWDFADGEEQKRAQRAEVVRSFNARQDRQTPSLQHAHTRLTAYLDKASHAYPVVSADPNW